MILDEKVTVDETLIAAINILQSGPYSITERIGDSEGFLPVKQVTTTTATPNEEILNNITKNIRLDCHKFHTHKEFQKIKDTPIAIVGGGPSLKSHLEELRDFKKIIVAGSAHDFLAKHFLVPDICVLCDPSPLTLGYLKHNHPHTEYFVASACDPSVFEHLRNNKVYIWHCYSEQNKEFLIKLEPDCHMIGGGCTVGLRSINIAIMMGYHNIHLFGFDSCLTNDKVYAYDFVNKKEESTGLGETLEIKLDPDSDKKYKVLGYQLAQADHFKDFLYSFGGMVTFTFHGDGLLRDIHDRIKQDIQRLNGVSND